MHLLNIFYLLIYENFSPIRQPTHHNYIIYNFQKFKDWITKQKNLHTTIMTLIPTQRPTVRSVHDIGPAVLHNAPSHTYGTERDSSSQWVSQTRLHNARRVSDAGHVRLLRWDLSLRLARLHRHCPGLLHRRLHVRSLRWALHRPLRYRQVYFSTSLFWGLIKWIIHFTEGNTFHHFLYE